MTEQVWEALNAVALVRGLYEPKTAEESVCIASWPAPLGLSDETARSVVDHWREAIKALRNLRAERNVPKDARTAPIIIAQGGVALALKSGEPFLRSLAPAESVTIVPAVHRPAECAVAVLPEMEIILPLEGLIDHEAERAKRRKMLADVERQIGALSAKMGNESFVARAPAEVVEQTRASSGSSNRSATRSVVYSVAADRWRSRSKQVATWCSLLR